MGGYGACGGGLWVDTGPVRGSVVGEVSGTGEEMRVWTNSICKHIGPVREREAEKSCVCVRGHPGYLSRDVTACDSVHGKCLHWGDTKWNSAGMYVEVE